MLPRTGKWPTTMVVSAWLQQKHTTKMWQATWHKQQDVASSRTRPEFKRWTRSVVSMVAASLR